ncbi:MAG: GNAT family N-acetyltransferase [Phycisphaerales bacterium]|nr:GNAT family N-acetyltransferase [Phycisphaerales bacterium]
MSLAHSPAAFTIRPAGPPDLPAWLALRMAFWPEDSEAAHREQMADILGDADQAALLLFQDGGRLCGFAEVTIHPRAIGCETHRVGYLEGWFVEEGLRRCGHGRRLVEEAERWAASRGAREMASDTQLDNGISRAAHARLGYEEVQALVHFRKRLRSD